MKILLVVIGLIVLMIPGGMPLLILWGIVFPRQRQEMLTIIFKLKGDIFMAVADSFKKGRILVGKSTEQDKEYAQKVDVGDLDNSRVEGVDKAFSYLETKLGEKAVSWAPAAVVVSFGLGAAVVVVLWIFNVPAIL